MADKKEKCVVCSKTVFAMEKVSVEGAIFHEGCFKCAQCKKKLSPGTYTALEGTYYCKPHYTQLFTSKGNYSEGFGKEKPTAHWAPSTATYEGPASKPAEKGTPSKTPAAPAGPPGPPGPPPPPPPADLGSPSEGNDSGGAHAAALASIASGGFQLKHVSREDRKRPPVSSVVPGDSKPKAAPVTSHKDGINVKTGTPETKLDDNKWLVRYHTGPKDQAITITPTAIKQSVTISDCKNSMFIIAGKTTNISVMNCIDVGVIFEDVIASVEVTRCNKIQLQANGKVAQIIVDKVNSVDIFIQTNEGKNVEVVSSLANALNINYPGATEDDDPVEYPIPDQFKSVIQNGKLITVPSSHV